MRSTVYIPYIVFGYLSLFTLGLLDNVRGPYFPDIAKALALSDSKSAFLFVTTSFVSFLIGRSVPALLTQMNVLNLLRLGHLSMGVGFVGLASMQGLYSMIAAAAVFGIGFGTVNVAQNILILEGSPVGLRRRLLSGLHSVYAFASLFSPLVVATLFELQFDWREGFLVLAAVPLFAFFYSFFCREQESERTQGSAIPMRHNPRQIIWFSLGLGFYVVAEVLIATRLVLYLTRQFGFDTAQASYYLTAFFVLMLMGRLLFTFVHFAVFSNRQIVRLCLLGATFVFTVGLFVSPLLLVLSGVFMGPVFGVSIDYASEVFKSGVATALSKILALQALLIVGMHYLVGVLSQYFGISVALALGSVFMLASLLIVHFEPWRRLEPEAL